MSRKGFTLIELMIVVAIIAVIAAIAIPNLLAARRASNESAAVAACRSYVGAQSIFRRTDWDGDGQLEYAMLFQNLNQTLGKDGQPINLIDDTFAAAQNAQTAKAGYFFSDIVSRNATAFVTDTGGNGYLFDFGLCANPANYGRSGLNTYIIDTQGTVFQLDQGASRPVLDFPGSPLAAGWIATGE